MARRVDRISPSRQQVRARYKGGLSDDTAALPLIPPPADISPLINSEERCILQRFALFVEDWLRTYERVTLKYGISSIPDQFLYDYLLTAMPDWELLKQRLAQRSAEPQNLVLDGLIRGMVKRLLKAPQMRDHLCPITGVSVWQVGESGQTKKYGTWRSLRHSQT